MWCCVRPLFFVAIAGVAAVQGALLYDAFCACVRAHELRMRTSLTQRLRTPGPARGMVAMAVFRISKLS